MMNKKGITIGRILLYVLFLTLIGIFIYTCYVTYKKIHEPKEENSIIRKVDNNSVTINPVDSISYLNMTLMENPFGTGSNNPFYPNNSFSVTPYASSTNIYNGAITSNSYDLLIANTFENYKVNYNIVTIPDTYVYQFMSFKCNINVTDFNFTITGSDATDYYSLFFVTDTYMNENNIITNFNRIDNLRVGSHYNFVDIRPSSTANASKILYFGFGVCSTITYNTKFFINTNYKVNASSNPSFPLHLLPTLTDITMSFDPVVLTGNNQEIWQDGYDKGYQTAIESTNNAVGDLVDQNNVLSSQVYDLTSRVNQQATIIESLQAQLNNANNGFKSLFFTMADIPFKTVHNALGFEFWGVNLFTFFVGIITALGLLWLIKKIL